MKIKWQNNAFTLVEVIVAVTILSIIMVSVMSIFVNSSQVSAKIDINRILQENSKNIIETIAEDIRQKWFVNCEDRSLQNLCIWDDNFSSWSELWLWDSHYYLATKDNSIDEYIKIENLQDCDEKQCFLLKNWSILSNSYVKVKNLEFSLFSDHIPKLQINFILLPMERKWVQSNLIKNSEINIQTSLSSNFLAE